MRKTTTTLAMLCATALLVSGCQSSAPSTSSSSSSEPSLDGYQQTSRDGAPWWSKDVSDIQDAVPTPHFGPYKAAPYTVLGKKYYPMQSSKNYKEDGLASWYGTKFHGQKTANGEIYDLYGMTAAHKTLPLPSYVKVINLDNNREVIVRVNDRGPFYADRIIDLSFPAAKKLGFVEKGVARVRVEAIDPETWWAEQGKKAPVIGTYQAPKGLAMPAEEVYDVPANQHAAAVVPLQIREQPATATPQGLFLQAGAFANPDAAQLLADRIQGMTEHKVFVNSIVIDQQVLHRVRIGPIGTRDAAENLQQRIRAANLGTPSLVLNN